MISRIEQVRSDVLAVLSNRVEPLTPLANARLFITGGTGFLGTWLLELIAVLNTRYGFNTQVTVYSRSARDFASSHPHLGHVKEFQFIDGDIRYLSEIPRDTDYILHAAALTDRRLFASTPTAVGEVNTLGTLRLLRAANLVEELKKIVLVSSGLVYGPQPLTTERLEEKDFRTGFPSDNANAIYAESKRFAESLATSFISENKLPVVIVRPFAFVGPYQSLQLPWAITDFIRDSLAGRPIKIMGNGATVRSLMYASDFAYWTLAALAKGNLRNAYNIGSPEGIDLLTLARQIIQHFNPAPEILTKVGQSGHETTRLVPSVDKAMRDLGVTLTVPLPEALRKTIAWHKTEPKN